MEEIAAGLGSLASGLRNLADALERRSGIAESNATFADAVTRAREMLRERRSIGAYFDPDLFGDASYDILLDLFVAEAEGKAISVSSCCLGAGVPTTTALRWINQLAERSIVEIQDDPFDGRKRLVQLSSDAHARLTTFLSRQLRQR